MAQPPLISNTPTHVYFTSTQKLAGPERYFLTDGRTFTLTNGSVSNVATYVRDSSGIISLSDGDPYNTVSNTRGSAAPVSYTGQLPDLSQISFPDPRKFLKYLDFLYPTPAPLSITKTDIESYSIVDTNNKLVLLDGITLRRRPLLSGKASSVETITVGVSGDTGTDMISYGSDIYVLLKNGITGFTIKRVDITNQVSTISKIVLSSVTPKQMVVCNGRIFVLCYTSAESFVVDSVSGNKSANFSPLVKQNTQDNDRTCFVSNITDTMYVGTSTSVIRLDQNLSVTGTCILSGFTSKKIGPLLQIKGSTLFLYAYGYSVTDFNGIMIFPNLTTSVLRFVGDVPVIHEQFYGAECGGRLLIDDSLKCFFTGPFRSSLYRLQNAGTTLSATLTQDGRIVLCLSTSRVVVLTSSQFPQSDTQSPISFSNPPTAVPPPIVSQPPKLPPPAPSPVPRASRPVYIADPVESIQGGFITETVLDNNGNMYVMNVGGSQAKIIANNGNTLENPQNLTLFKLDANKALQFYLYINPMGTANPDCKLAVDSQLNFYVMGVAGNYIEISDAVGPFFRKTIGSSRATFIIKFDPNGNVLYFRYFTLLQYKDFDIKCDPSGCVYITSKLSSTTPVPIKTETDTVLSTITSATNTGLLIKLDILGNHVFTCYSTNTSFKCIDIDHRGNVYIGGSYTGATSGFTDVSGTKIVSYPNGSTGASVGSGLVVKVSSAGIYDNYCMTLINSNCSIIGVSHDSIGAVYVVGQKLGLTNITVRSGSDPVGSYQMISTSKPVFFLKSTGSVINFIRTFIGTVNSCITDRMDNTYIYTNSVSRTIEDNLGTVIETLNGIGSPNEIIYKFDLNGSLLRCKTLTGISTIKSRSLSVDNTGNHAYMVISYSNTGPSVKDYTPAGDIITTDGTLPNVPSTPLTYYIYDITSNDPTGILNTKLGVEPMKLYGPIEDPRELIISPDLYVITNRGSYLLRRTGEIVNSWPEKVYLSDSGRYIYILASSPNPGGTGIVIKGKLSHFDLTRDSISFSLISGSFPLSITPNRIIISSSGILDPFSIPPGMVQPGPSPFAGPGIAQPPPFAGPGMVQPPPFAGPGMAQPGPSPFAGPGMAQPGPSPFAGPGMVQPPPISGSQPPPGMVQPGPSPFAGPGMVQPPPFAGPGMSQPPPISGSQPPPGMVQPPPFAGPGMAQPPPISGSQPGTTPQVPFSETMLTKPVSFLTTDQTSISVRFVYKKDGTGYRNVFTSSSSNKGPFFTYTKDDKEKKIVYTINGKRYETTVWPEVGSEPQ